MKPITDGPRPTRLKFMGHKKIKHLELFKVYDVEWPGCSGRRIVLVDERGQRSSYHVCWFEPVAEPKEPS